VAWEPGDGGPSVTCATGGTTTGGDCTHTYVQSSSGARDGTYALTATITWEIAWTATTGEGGTLEAVTRTATIPLTVQQAQAVLD
jgi:hypothetical protein